MTAAPVPLHRYAPDWLAVVMRGLALVGALILLITYIAAVPLPKPEAWAWAVVVLYIASTM